MTAQPRNRVIGDPDDVNLDLEFVGELWQWRGPPPYYFVTVPGEESSRLQAISRSVTYGWGMIPVLACIGSTRWETSLFRKDGLYVVPVKVAVRRAEGLDDGDVVTVRLVVADPP